MLGLSSGDRRARYRKIVGTLSRHGLGALANRTGTGGLVPFHRGHLGHARRDTPYSTPEHLRLALEELGTAAIKLGQILSTRPDLLPPNYVVELEKLRDGVPPVAADEIVHVIERELGSSVGQIFPSFDREPLAAASIGQVHTATLADGSRVVIKVRKPGVTETVAQDLGIAADIARRLARSRGWDQHYDIEAVVDEFAWTLRAELDYLREARNMDRLREVLSSNTAIVIPQVHWKFTTESVLVMDRVEGRRLQEAVSGPDPERYAGLGKAGAEAWLTQIFNAGFFHADPHPGNFLITADDRLAVLDFGMVGHLDDDLRARLMQLLVAVAQQDAAEATLALESLGVLRTPNSRESVQRDLQHLLDAFYGLPLDEFDIPLFLRDLMGVMRRNQLQLPAQLALVIKTVAMSDALWRTLDPGLNLAVIAEPFARRAQASEYSLRGTSRRVLSAARAGLDVGLTLPGQLSRLAARLDRGDFEVKLRHRDLDESLDRLSAMVTRLSSAMVASALIIGLAVVGAAERPPLWPIIALIWFFGGTGAALGLVMRLVVLGRRKPPV